MALDDQMLARARSFGSVAQEYDRLRPGYPEAVFDDLLIASNARRVLDIGAGTGKATLSLLDRGLEVVALEPSAEMAQVLRERAAAAGHGDRLRVEVSTFEEIDPALRFDLVIAAQSFHWVDPATRWQRLADVLLPEGTAGLIWNAWMLDPETHDHDAIRQIFAEYGPGLRPDTIVYHDDDTPPEGLDQVSALAGLEHRRYEWTWTLDTTDYLHLLETTSQFAVLDAEPRAVILRELGTVLGERTDLRCNTLLMLVHREAGPLDEILDRLRGATTAVGISAAEMPHAGRDAR